jgi:hypothetical protein
MRNIIEHSCFMLRSFAGRSSNGQQGLTNHSELILRLDLAIPLTPLNLTAVEVCGEFGGVCGLAPK